MSAYATVASPSTTGSTCVRRYNYFKLVVAYDGTRFHGFQRQIDNDTLMQQYHNKKLMASLRPKKRPHYHDVGIGAATTISSSTSSNDREGEAIPNIRKGCNISIQEVLEFALLDMYTGNHSSSSTTTTATTVRQRSPLPLPPLSGITVHEMNLKFAGRTDKGVHANGQVCLVKLPCKNNNNNNNIHSEQPPQLVTRSSGGTTTTSTTTNKDGEASTVVASHYYDYHCWKLRNDLNSRLPIDISIQHASQLFPDNNINSTDGAILFDPRRDVTLKKYTYTIRYRRRRSTDTITFDEENSVGAHEQHLQQMIEQHGGPHSIRNATTDSYCLWIVPWALCDDAVVLPRLCQQFMGTQEKDFYHFIHKADRDNPKKTTMHRIQEMSYEIKNISTEYISTTNQDASPPTTTVVSSEIVTGQFTLIAKSFRRTMIRNIVGYCIDVCRARGGGGSTEAPPSIESLLLQKDNGIDETTDGSSQCIANDNDDHYRTKAKNGRCQQQRPQFVVNGAPASGLCLEWVTY